MCNMIDEGYDDAEKWLIGDDGYFFRVDLKEKNKQAVDDGKGKKDDGDNNAAENIGVSLIGTNIKESWS